MTEQKKNFKRVAGDGSTINVIGASDTGTASELGDLLSKALAYAVVQAERQVANHTEEREAAIAEARAAFLSFQNEMDGAIASQAGNDRPLHFNIGQTIAENFCFGYLKKCLGKPHQMAIDEIEANILIQAAQRSRLNEKYQEFADNFVQEKLSAYFPTPGGKNGLDS